MFILVLGEQKNMTTTRTKNKNLGMVWVASRWVNGWLRKVCSLNLRHLSIMLYLTVREGQNFERIFVVNNFLLHKILSFSCFLIAAAAAKCSSAYRFFEYPHRVIIVWHCLKIKSNLMAKEVCQQELLVCVTRFFPDDINFDEFLNAGKIKQFH